MSDRCVVHIYNIQNARPCTCMKHHRSALGITGNRVSTASPLCEERVPIERVQIYRITMYASHVHVLQLVCCIVICVYMLCGWPHLCVEN